MKTLVLTDIHGFYYTAKKVIDLDIFDKIIFLGDYCDRGLNTKKVIELLKEMKNKYNDDCIILRGNHDIMWCEAVLFRDITSKSCWYNNGGFQTIDSYHSEDMTEDCKWLVKNSQWLYKFDNYRFSHSLYPQNEDEELLSSKDGIDFYNSFNRNIGNDYSWNRDYFYKNEDLIYVHGHTPTVIPIKDNDIDLDAGCVRKHRMAYMIIEDDECTIEYMRADSRDYKKESI